MKKEKYEKIPISTFISDKELEKINKIIHTSECVETAYDRIESLLDDDYKILGLGTNRLILIHKKDKYKNLVFKVAGDTHGIEANYREFYNGDLDKRLTFSYSISDDGIFVVQERVKVFDSKTMDKKKKDVRKMLSHLSEKLLLVDCKISNFRNFGIRKNDEIVLLDHGDTVPLSKFQSSRIVNIDEESNVSLRCKKFKEASEKTSKLKPCGGKLEYSKNYDYLKCSRCGSIMSVNDAYKEFYGDKNANIDIHSDFIDGLNFDPDEWSKTIKEYAKDTMSSVNKNNNEKGECKMKEKVIGGKKCVQMKGYWVPEEILNNSAYSMLLNSVKLNKTKPKDFIKSVGLDPNTYAVRIEDHTPNKEKAEWKENIPMVVNEMLKIMKEHDENKYFIFYKELEERCGFVVDSIEKEKEIFKKVISGCSVDKLIYKKDKFIVIVSEAAEKETKNSETVVNQEDVQALLGIQDNIKELSEIQTDDDMINDSYEEINIDPKEMRFDNSVVEEMSDIADDIINDEDDDDNESYFVIDNPRDSGNETKIINPNIVDEYDFCLIEDAIINKLLPNYELIDGYFKIKRVPLADIEDFLSKFNNIYDGIFEEVSNISDETVRLNLMRLFLDEYVDLGEFTSVASNIMHGPELEFMMDNVKTYDDEDEINEEELDEEVNDVDEYEEKAEAMPETIKNSSNLDDSLYKAVDDVDKCIKMVKNEELIIDEHSDNDNSKEDAELTELKNMVKQLSERVQDVQVELMKLTERVIEIENRLDNEDEEESEDSDDDSHDNNVINGVGYTEENNILTIDIDSLPENIDIVLNKEGILYRLNPSVLKLTGSSNFPEEGLYDIVKMYVTRYGTSTEDPEE